MKYTAVIFFLSFPIVFLFSQDKYDFDYTINSDAFGEERKFYVHVHEDYYLDTLDSFGVVYVLDAQASSFYNNAKSIIDYLVWSYQISPMIVVGIHSDNRQTEFIPLDRALAEDSPKNNGQAHLFRAHIENEIFTKVAKDFRVNEFKAIIGHSRAGSFIANTIFGDKKDMFDAYIAISPGMHYVNNQVLNEAEKQIKEKRNFHKFYYCSYGTVGSLEAYFEPQVNYLDSLFTVHPNNTIEWRKKEMPGKTHWGVVAPSIADGLLEMNRAYQVDQFLIEQFAEVESSSIGEQVSEYYQGQKEKLKIVFPIKASRFRYFANDFSEVEDYKTAIELYDLSIARDKSETRTYLNKADAYKELKDFGNAKLVYEEALKVIEKNEAQFEKEKIDKLKNQVLEKLVKLAKQGHK